MMSFVRISLYLKINISQVAQELSAVFFLVIVDVRRVKKSMGMAR